MTFDEAIQAGLDLLQGGKPVEALSVFNQVEAAFPGNPVSQRLIGKVCLGIGRHKEGVEALVEAVRRDPHPDIILELVRALSHLGASGDLESVCRYHQGVIEGDDRFHHYRGLAQIYLGRFEEAVESLTRARTVFPNWHTINHNLAIALMGCGRGEEAVECFSALLPDWDGGEADVTGVERLDSIAEDYDANDLHHFFSDRLLRLYLENFPGRRLGRVLELGTGTGLLASKLPASATSVTGIERSSSMLVQARQRQVYGEVIEGCLPGILETLGGPFDTILSSCVLYYFADLQPFFAQAARLLAPGGAFLFSVDPLADPREVAVTGPGEYAHSRAYLRRLAAAAGFKETAIEIDRHRGSPGFWCGFKKV